MSFVNGQTINAHGRLWTVVCAPEGDTDLVIADPHFTDEEHARIRRVDKVNESPKGKVHIPYDVYVQRAVLELSEVAA